MKFMCALFVLSLPTRSSAQTRTLFTPSNHYNLFEKSETSPFDTLRAKIETYQNANPGRTISLDQALGLLPEDLLAEFTAIHGSRSLQESSFRFPRILLYGREGKSIIAFNGDPESEGYNTLEFAEINALNNQLEFREMIFPKLSDKRDVAGTVSFSQKNPDQCTSCHGKPAHYIWNPYSTWPGGTQERHLLLP